MDLEKQDSTLVSSVVRLRLALDLRRLASEEEHTQKN